VSTAISAELSRGVLRPVRGHAFESCVEQLATAIRLGVYPLNSSLPAERELAERLGVSRTTLREAIAAHARALAERRDLEPAAEEASQAAQRAMMAELERVLNDWYSLLVDKFSGAVATFRSIPVSRIDGSEDEATILAFGKRTKAANEMHYLWAERCALGAAVEEATGLEVLVWTVVAPPAFPPADANPEVKRGWVECVQAYRDLERYWTQGIATMEPAARWDLLLAKRAELQLAGRGEARTRSGYFADVARGYGARPMLTAQAEELDRGERMRALLTPPDYQAA
jgi:hypothetical protein